jgi:hypothetical protein
MARTIATLSPVDSRAGVGEDEEDGAGRQTVGDEGEILLRALVRPVEILVDHHLWPALRLAVKESTQGVEQLRPTLLGIQAGHGGVSGVDRQEVADVGED